jgi:very-short-patch-repair endonuclease
MAAVLACGGRSVLSHRSAAALWGLRASSRTKVDVTSPRRSGRRRSAIDVHSGATLGATDVTTLRGIPCTTVARTLLDLAEVVNRTALERACDQAEVLQIFDARAIEEVLERASGRRGASTLRAVLDGYAIGEALTRNDIEELFLAICVEAKLPRPRVNQWVTLDGEEVQIDFLWPAERLAVETDGYGTHRTRVSFERDRWRDQQLAVAGWQPLRFTWRQIVDRPQEVAATLARMLRNRAPG